MKKIIVFILIILFLGGAFFWLGVYFPQNPDSQKEILFNIQKGEGVREISANLKKEGLVRQELFFQIYVFFRGDSKKLRAGTYSLSSSMNAPQIVNKFIKGDVKKIKITIPEGFTSEQIYQRIVQATGADNTILKNILEENEGYLFPDTYEILYGMSPEDIVKMMRDHFNAKIADLNIAPEIVVMASLLERELQTKEDKEMASGILWKRLRIGMPLQVDAFPWTYENRGLPQKPIANPGLESMEAAKYPKNSDYWYYLSSPDGKTIFSRTLEEHNIARAKYLR